MYEPDGQSLPSAIRSRIEAIALRLSIAWRDGRASSLEALLDQLPEYKRTLFARLLAVEIEARRRCGHLPSRQEYLRRFPDYRAEIDQHFIQQTLGSDRIAQPSVAPRDGPTRSPSETRTLLESEGLGPAGRINAHGPGSGVAATDSDGPFPVFDNYQILAELGRGGMGVVYRAMDLKLGQVVALKTMLHMDPSRLARFKQEFRTLSDVHHEHLAELYEFVLGEDQCYFTMELIDGCDFFSYVRKGVPENQVLPSSHIPVLMNSLIQVCEALIALHDAGKVHRDIKPSNVMVTPEGRVVVLDFGLTIDVEEGGAYQTRDGHVVGTPAYMSPEQARGGSVTSASDWYSVGVLLYFVLTGQLPFEGTSSEILRDKLACEPDASGRLVRGLPSGLNELCLRLLSRDLNLRPDGRSVLQWLGDPPAAAVVRPSSLPFVGRANQLNRLHNAYAELRSRRPASVLIRGLSGSGKSTLISHFVSQLREQEDVLVFSSRCYGRELVPYKAVDELIDGLSRYLLRLSFEQVDALMPRDVGALSHVFPTLRQVDAIRRAPPREDLPADRLELRLRAFAGLREMLSRLGDRKRLILIIDDLQWGDRDSTALLSHVLQQPDAPVLLFIGLFRSEEIDAGSILIDLLPSSTVIEMEALAFQECAELARQLLPTYDVNGSGAKLLDRIAEESMGSPLVLRELAIGISQDEFKQEDGQYFTYEELLWSRIGQLADAPRRLLFTLAIAGKPLAAEFLVKVAELPSLAVSDAIVTLRGKHFLRDCAHGVDPLLDTFHDRVREVVILRLDAEEQQAIHQRLAQYGERVEEPDAHFLALHYRAAGISDKAATHYVTAADEASEKLAFHRAAELYAEALALQTLPAESQIPLRLKRAEALSNAGHNLQAAKEYLDLANHFGGAEGLEMRRRAFAQFQFMGRIEQAKQVLTQICDEIGQTVPKTAMTTLALIILTHLRLTLFHLTGRWRRSLEIASDEGGRVDAYWSITTAMTHVDYLRAAYFSARHLLHARKLGDPQRLARALALESGLSSAVGWIFKRKSEALLKNAGEIATGHDDPFLKAALCLCKGIRAGCLGAWQDSFDNCGSAEAHFKLMRRAASSTGPNEFHAIFGNVSIAQFWQLYSLTWLGQVETLNQRCEFLREDARRRNDLFNFIMIGSYCHSFLRLTQDKEELGLRELRTTMHGWEVRGFYLQHHLAVCGESSLLLYGGQYSAAKEVLRMNQPRYRKSWFLSAHVVRSQVRDLFVRSLLMAAATEPTNRSLLRDASRSRFWLAAERLPWTTALATAYRGSIAAIRQDRRTAERYFTKAAERFAAVNMELHAAVVSLRAGEMIGGEEGQQRIMKAECWMSGQGVGNPRKMAKFLMPSSEEL